jgi:DNA polymerase-3 subunit epsilon
MSTKKRYAVVDLETTGGMALRDKITEIAIVLTDGEKIIDSYSTLVNPERSIPNEITRITGITNAMVADAPKFYEVAKEVVQWLEGSIFVAHNVRFDYSFLREEFSRLGYTFTKRQLCTVRLSRKAFPGLKSYSLGNLIIHFGLSVDARHRALDDALATTTIFHKILNNEENLDAAKQLINLGLKESQLPKGLSLDQLHSLPEIHGVYYFINSYGVVVYVGKSIDIKKRVFQHFTKTNQKALRMAMMVQEISYEITGNELIALLHESAEIKRLRPEINKAQKNQTYPYFIYREIDEKGYFVFRILKSGKKNEKNKNILGFFKSKIYAKSTLEYIREELQLCGNKTELDQMAPFPCHYFHLKKCLGSCNDIESVEAYNTRAELAGEILNQKFSEDFILLGEGREKGEKSVVLVEDGHYRGFGFASEETLSYGIEEIKEVINYVTPNPETNRIIRLHLTNPKYQMLKI